VSLEIFVNSSRLRNCRDYGYPIDQGILELMGEVSILPTTCGLLIEKYLIPSIITDFLKYDTIDQHPYFAEWTQLIVTIVETLIF
jgi:hypothetical protein